MVQRGYAKLTRGLGTTVFAPLRAARAGPVVGIEQPVRRGGARDPSSVAHVGKHTRDRVHEPRHVIEPEHVYNVGKVRVGCMRDQYGVGLGVALGTGDQLEPLAHQLQPPENPRRPRLSAARYQVGEVYLEAVGTHVTQQVADLVCEACAKGGVAGVHAQRRTVRIEHAFFGRKPLPRPRIEPEEHTAALAVLSRDEAHYVGPFVRVYIVEAIRALPFVVYYDSAGVQIVRLQRSEPALVVGLRGTDGGDTGSTLVHLLRYLLSPATEDRLKPPVLHG